MQLTITGPREIIEAMNGALIDVSRRLENEDELLGLSGLESLAIAAHDGLKRVKQIYKVLLPFIAARPQLEFEIGGGNNKAKMKLKNISEQTLTDAIARLIKRDEELRSKETKKAAASRKRPSKK